MIKETELAYAEVDEIINLLDEEYANKIPAQVKEFFKKEKDKEYIPNINKNISLADQNLKDETISILTLLQINYLCNEEEKKEILNELKEIDKIKENELREKYNPDNIFRNRNNMQEKEVVAMIEYKQPNIIRKLLNKIIKLFKR